LITHKDDNEEETGFELFGLIESKIREYHPPHEEKWIQRLSKSNREQALILMVELEQYKPVMGLHQWPRDLKEMKEAIQFQVDKDDYNETKYK
jgi:hypothetical protein